MKQEKQLLLDEIKHQLDQSGAFLITEYKQLSAPKATKFRKELRGAKSHFEVVKKRLLLKLLEKEGIKLNLDSLPGHIGIVFAEKDILDACKKVLKFSEDNETPFNFIGAKIEGAMLSGQDTKKLALLPSLDVLRAQFVGLLVAPLAGLVTVFKAQMETVVSTLEAKVEEGQKA